jgi:hypothetical protein
MKHGFAPQVRAIRTRCLPARTLLRISDTLGHLRLTRQAPRRGAKAVTLVRVLYCLLLCDEGEMD